ncbi:hypothetical protein BR93DRAFT_990294 [Coniochaeta sp. PMI_546]|nr:hypothetical protein BR93DRAFT_990294 [Coniochaeta sp. PMI_546]
MMHSIAATAGSALYKRAVDGGGNNPDDPKQVSGWVFLVFLANFLVFLPLALYVSYTLGQLFPALAIVENTDPPAYEPLALNDDAADGTTPPKNDAGKPISSSLRALNRLLYSVGGWRSSFRGIGAYLAYSFAVSFVAGLFSALPFVPAFVGTLLASLALVQLSTAWVHIAISPPNPAYFWRRLPPFRKALEATWLPTLAAWAAGTLAAYLPALTAYLVDLPLYDPSKPNDLPTYDRHAAWKVLVLLLVTLSAWALVIVPTEVLLVRVQASLLPPDEDTIIPFDRTYDGTLEPAVVGQGYVSVRDALKTFPRASWVRIYILHAKIFGAVLLAYGLMMAVFIPQALLLKL